MLAADEYICEKVHLDFAYAIAFARFTSAALNVERKAPGLVAVDLALGEFREEAPDLVEDLDIGGGITARGSADRTLVDVDDLVELLEAGNVAMATDPGVAADEFASRGGIENIIHERRLARSRYAGHSSQNA